MTSNNPIVANALAADEARNADGGESDKKFAERVGDLIPLLKQADEAIMKARMKFGGIAFMIEKNPSYFEGGVGAYRRLISKVIAGDEALAEIVGRL